MGMILYLRPVDESEARTLASDGGSFEEFMFGEQADEGDAVVDFDKAWHVIHYLLTGSAGTTESPLSIFFGVGEPIGRDDGYGQPLLISPRKMVAFRDALQLVSDEQLRDRYDLKAMVDEQVYLSDTLVDEPEEESWEYVSQGLPSLRRFAERAADQGLAAISMIA